LVRAEQAMGVEAIIFDFGGVVTTSPFDAFNRFGTARELPKDVLRQVNANNAQDDATGVDFTAETLV
jgi:putative hydrolase of the HAD superfamily